MASKMVVLTSERALSTSHKNFLLKQHRKHSILTCAVLATFYVLLLMNSNQSTPVTKRCDMSLKVFDENGSNI